ncbi:MAG: hypothetical protein CBB60_000730 [Armatimonadetes bacterium Cent15-Ar3]|jgi:hypothetical protein|nr:MAG: hypothetical protein CBB60_000730 [Armatimonadetes bacterium Cent15-Ar3]
MSEPNLNANPIKVETRERFDLKKHVHDESVFFSGVKMFVSAIASVAALVVALFGGTYLLITGTPPDFYQKPVEAEVNIDEKALTPAQEKSLQETITELFDDYRRRNNEGKFPTEMATSEFSSADRIGRVESSPNQREGRPVTIKAIKLLSFSSTGPESGVATVEEVTAYKSTFKDWFSNAGGTSHQGDIVLEERTEYEYRLIRQGGWKLASRKVNRASPILIQQADEAGRTWLTKEGDAVFDDSRPSKESLLANYERITQGFKDGYLAYQEFPSSYTVQVESKAFTKSELEIRFQRLRQNAMITRAEFTIESVDQTGLNAASATVRYELEFIPLDSSRQNHYVAVWRDVDDWTRVAETSKLWSRKSTRRKMSSPILQHYEEKTPPAPLTSTTPESPNNGLLAGE